MSGEPAFCIFDGMYLKSTVQSAIPHVVRQMIEHGRTRSVHWRLRAIQGRDNHFYRLAYDQSRCSGLSFGWSQSRTKPLQEAAQKTEKGEDGACQDLCPATSWMCILSREAVASNYDPLRCCDCRPWGHRHTFKIFPVVPWDIQSVQD